MKFAIISQSTSSNNSYNLDFAPYSPTRIFSLFKTNQATINYPVRISRNGNTGAEQKYVFFDECNIVSLNSQVSSTTTANESTTLQEFIDAGVSTDDYNVTNLYCQITQLDLAALSTLSGAPFLAENAATYFKNLMPSIKFRGTTTSVLRGANLSELDDTNDFSIATVTSAGALSDADIIFTTNTTDATPFSRHSHVNRGDITNTAIIRNTSGVDFVLDLTAVQNTTNQKELATTLDYGTEFKGYYAGVLQDTESITSVGFTNNTFDIGAGMSQSFPFLGQFQFLMVSDTIWSSTKVSSLRYFLNRIFKYETEYNIVCDGNSLTAGQGATSGQTYPVQLGALLTTQGATAAVENKGVGAQNTQDMEADASTDIDPLYDSSKSNYLLVWEGRNDLNQNNGLTVQQAYNNLVTYCENRQAVGWKVILFSLLPSYTASYNGDTTVAGYEALEADRVALNVLLKANWTFFADGYVDFDSDPEINTFHNNEQSGYVYSSSTAPTASTNGLYTDGTHLTNAGYAIVAKLALNELVRLNVKQ